jgi:hypothetical protein
MDDESSVLAARIYALARQPRREFAVVEAGAEPGYDRRWYERVTREFAPLGFVSVGDYQALHRAPHDHVVLRLLMSRHGTIVATASSAAPARGAKTAGWRRWFGSASRTRTLELETEFSDGNVLLTDNGAGLDALEPPLAIERHAMPGATPLRELFEVHAARIKEIFHTRHGVKPRPLCTVDEWLASQQRQHALVTAYRRRIGWVTDDELEALAGASFAAIRETARLELRRLAEAGD